MLVNALSYIGLYLMAIAIQVVSLALFIAASSPIWVACWLICKRLLGRG